MRKVVSVLVLCALISAVTAGPRKSHHAGDPRDLSDEQHYGEGEGHEHNVQYDHEAFLGKEESDKFDKLSRDEARRKLSLLVDRVDKDGDGSVSQNELKDWIKYISRRYFVREGEQRWKIYDKNEDGFIDLEEYKTAHFGVNYEPDSIYDKMRQLTYKQAVDRYNKRFTTADVNGDGKLDLEEFVDFLHPAEVDRMLPLYIDERMRDMDKNQDGKVTPQEYIGDIWHPRDGEEEPSWLDSERENFGKHRDRNKDGTLDKEEVAYMIKPPGYDVANAESMHLLREADTNKDNQLSKEEILSHQDLFVGSRATNYGDYIKHDEF